MGRGERLRNGTRDSSEGEIGCPIFEGQLLLRHVVNTVTFSRPLLSPIMRIMTDPKRIMTKKILGRRALLEGRAPNEVTEHGSFLRPPQHWAVMAVNAVL